MGELAVGEVLSTKDKLLLGLSYAYRAEASTQAGTREPFTPFGLQTTGSEP